MWWRTGFTWSEPGPYWEYPKVTAAQSQRPPSYFTTLAVLAQSDPDTGGSQLPQRKRGAGRGDRGHGNVQSGSGHGTPVS